MSVGKGSLKRVQGKTAAQPAVQPEAKTVKSETKAVKPGTARKTRKGRRPAEANGSEAAAAVLTPSGGAEQVISHLICELPTYLL
ncbi:hypothetical protein [Lachnoclostridium sp. Marseille-P6806]|uniref:hypothetical protein n=1 Tax=Lachnoclostridium sp. Marseille-P6806 TaxID=2364793 RepID=UPI001031B17B|nr:hypothetical protein [Lachnoclostridium sp. Marseille-P6806]